MFLLTLTWLSWVSEFTKISQTSHWKFLLGTPTLPLLPSRLLLQPTRAATTFPLRRGRTLWPSSISLCFVPGGERVVSWQVCCGSIQIIYRIFYLKPRSTKISRKCKKPFFKKQKSNKKKRSLVPLLCASSWEMELTVTLQTGQWRWALLFLGSLSSSVPGSPLALDMSAWLPDSVVGPAASLASLASGASAVLVSEPVSESCEEGEIWGGERATNSTVETSDTGVSITELLGLSSSFTSRLAGSRSDWRPACKGRNKINYNHCFIRLQKLAAWIIYTSKQLRSNVIIHLEPCFRPHNESKSNIQSL